MTVQEIEYVYKLLKILRARNECSTIDAVKHTLDAFYLFSERENDDTENIMKEKIIS